MQVVGKGKQSADREGFVGTGRVVGQETAGIVKGLHGDQLLLFRLFRSRKEGINIAGPYLLPVHGGVQPDLNIVQGRGIIDPELGQLLLG